MQIDFHSSEGSSLGIEVELEIVDVDTRELHSGASEILADAGRPYADGAHPKAKHELLESTIEIITGICATAAEARADLEATIAELTPHLERRGLAPAGTASSMRASTAAATAAASPVPSGPIGVGRRRGAPTSRPDSSKRWALAVEVPTSTARTIVIGPV